ncbi:MAG TPA: sulfatase [Spirochaetia bacterium]|nr:sulfatase [Spirochaetia bacterium]
MKKKPNVLFVFGDQWRGQAVGYNGDPNVLTPNIDALHAESLNLVDATSGCPVCSPYRASFLSGLSPLNNGVFVNDVSLSRNSTSIGREFKNAGYNTAYVGKWHVDGRGRSAYIPPERRQGFDYWKALECTHAYQESYYYSENSRTKSMWNGYDAYAQTKDAIRYIDEYDDERPFFMVLSWGPPHAPYDLAPFETRRLYDPDRIRLRENVPESMGHPARELLAGYYAHCTALDECVGGLLDSLERNGIAENTILVFTSDHGDMLGSQGMWKKQLPFEESIRVPFLLRFPERFGRAGTRVEGVFIDAVDMMPTLLSIAGILPPAGIDGADLSPEFVGDSSARSENFALLACYHAFGQWRSNRDGGPLGYSGREYRGLRTRRYTYVRDLKGPWLLFDNEADPFQMRNLVSEPDGSNVVVDLENQLQTELSRRHDSFRPGMDYVGEWNYQVDSDGTVPWSW